MIKNKNQFIKAIKENKENISIKRVYNLNESNKIAVGTIRGIDLVQSNAIKLDDGCWMYFDSVEIKDTKIIYYDYIPENRKEEAEEIAKNRNIILETINLDDKINNNKYSNNIYVYKYITMINEIIEGMIK